MNHQIHKRVSVALLIVSGLAPTCFATFEFIDVRMPFQTTTDVGNNTGALPEPTVLSGYNGGASKSFFSVNLLFGQGLRWLGFPNNDLNGTQEIGIQMEGKFPPASLGVRSFKMRFRGEQGASKYWRISIHRKVGTDYVFQTTSERITLNAANQWQNVTFNWTNVDGHNRFEETDRIRIFPERENGLFVGLAAESGQTSSYSPIAAVESDNMRTEIKRKLGGILTIGKPLGAPPASNVHNVFTYAFNDSTSTISAPRWVTDFIGSDPDFFSTVGETMPNLADAGDSTNQIQVVPDLLLSPFSSGINQIIRYRFPGLGPTQNSSHVATWIGQSTNALASSFGYNEFGYGSENLLVETNSAGVRNHLLYYTPEQAPILPNLEGRQVLNMGDFDGDGRPDILTIDVATRNLYISYATLQSRSFASPVLVFNDFGNSTEILKVADLNDDGLDDLLIKDSMNSLFALKLAESSPGTLSFVYDWIWDLPSDVSQFAVADANGDDILDLYYARPSSTPGVKNLFIRNCSVSNDAIQVSSGDSWICQISSDYTIRAVADLDNNMCADVVVIQNIPFGAWGVKVPILNSALSGYPTGMGSIGENSKLRFFYHR